MEAAFGPGQVLLGKYRIESVLGRGGMGLVLRVTHLQLGEELALKVLSPEGVATPELHARFMREAQAVVRLRGEHVARVSDVGVLPDGTPYMVMEYLRGLDLSGELERRGRLFPGEAVDHVLQACEALAEAHANGVVHRDIKPANLFLTSRPDGTPLVKVLDFGISKAPVTETTRLTKTDTVMGTSGYMSPEQMRASKDVDARTDIWALGIVLYECLTGRRPFGGESFLAVALMAGTEPPPPMETWVPRPLQAVVLRCLAKDRNDRYPSIAALVAALAPFARDRRTAAVVVDRTNLLHQGAHHGGELTRSGRSPNATTLSGSARALRAGSLSNRRRTVAGIVALLGSITLLSLAGLLVTGRWKLASEPSYAGPEPDAGRPETEQPATAAAAAPAPSAPSVSAAVAVEPAPGDDKPRKLAVCTALGAQRKWQDLVDCAAGLDALGLKDAAREFRAKAVLETRNESTDAKAREALRNGSLKEAQALLRQVTADSVYRKSLSDAVDVAETQGVDDARRRAQGFVSSHDCAGLKRYVAQQTAIGTERTIAALKDLSARCTQRAQPAPLPAASAPPPAASAPSPATAQAQAACATMNVDDLMQQATLQYTNGFASTALSVMRKALACTQTVRLYRLAAMYACAAHDLATARTYYAKIPESMQSSIEQRCQQEGLNVRAP
jgi:serine/threonine-protein kinase